MHEAGLVREHDGLCTVAQPELVEHAADMGFHRGLGDEERPSDLAICAAAPMRCEFWFLPEGRGSTRYFLLVLSLADCALGI